MNSKDLWDIFFQMEQDFEKYEQEYKKCEKKSKGEIKSWTKKFVNRGSPISELPVLMAHIARAVKIMKTFKPSL